jgi:hypothetical protein
MFMLCSQHLMIHATWKFNFDDISNLYLHRNDQVVWK